MKVEIKNLKKKNIQRPKDTHEIIKAIFYKKKGGVDFLKKHLWTIALNRDGKILNIELVSIGSQNKNIAEPNDVFRVPLYKTSTYLIIVHNYHGDDPHPSADDMDVTDRLVQGGEILNVEVIDHVIVTDKTFYSFAEEGEMDRIRESDRYASAQVYKKRMERKLEEIKISTAKGVEKLVEEKKNEWKKKGMEQAIKDFHQGGIPLEKIAAITKKSVEDIKRIIS